MFSQAVFDNVVVSGHVFDWTGKPVEGATVSYFPLAAGVTGVLPRTLSDHDGSYRITVPALGPEAFYASKGSENDGDATMAVFATKDEVNPTINVVPDQSFKDVDIRLGKPGGHMTMEAVDSVTGAPVAARITLRWKENPDIYYSTNFSLKGLYSTGLPTRPLKLHVTAHGYKPWDYVDASNGHDYIEVGSYQEQSIKVELVPVHYAP